MKKAECIKRYGIEAYEKVLQQNQDWRREHPEENKETHQKWNRIWGQTHPREVKAHSQEQHRKGGKYYAHNQQHQMNGIPYEKGLVRGKHHRQWGGYKKIIDPQGLTQIHHDWVNNGTSDYRGVALVEKDQHQQGYIDVIQILEGEITLLTEEEIKIGGL